MNPLRAASSRGNGLVFGQVRLTVFVSLLLVTSSAASRADFRAKLTGEDPALALGINLTTSGNEPSGQFLAGQYDWQFVDGTKPSFIQGNTFSTFCIEITEYINPNTPYTYTVRDLKDAPQYGDGQGSGTHSGMGSARADLLQKLFDREYGAIKADFDNGTTPTDKKEAAAFQLAIWEIVFEGPLGSAIPSPLNVSSGNFYLTSAGAYTADVVALANGYLNNIGSYTGPKKFNLFAISNGTSTTPGYQDQIIATDYVPPPQVENTPVPPSAVLALTGIAPLLAFARRRRPRPTQSS